MTLKETLNQAIQTGYLLLTPKLPASLWEKAEREHFSRCAEVWPNVVVRCRGGVCEVEMDTCCFGSGFLDEQACDEVQCFFSILAGDESFPCGSSFFRVKRVASDDAPTLARALINIAIAAKTRADQTSSESEPQESTVAPPSGSG